MSIKQAIVVTDEYPLEIAEEYKTKRHELAQLQHQASQLQSDVDRLENQLIEMTGGDPHIFGDLVVN